MNNIIKIKFSKNDILYTKGECAMSNHQKIFDAIEYLKAKDCIPEKKYNYFVDKFVNNKVIDIIKDDTKRN